MAILNTTQDFKKYISISANFQFADVEPFIIQAVYKFTRKYVGNLHETLADVATGTDANIKNTARGYLQNALANFSFFIYLPFGAVNIDSTGVNQTKNEKRENVSWGQQRDLQRTFLENGHTAMDLLLEHLEQNKTVFPEWAENYLTTNQLIVNSTASFQLAYNIFDSRQTYMALVPSLQQVEDQYIIRFISDALHSHLVLGELNAVQHRLKVLLQKAIVSFTVAKVCTEGLFIISPDGLKVSFTSLPNDRTQPIDYGKASEFLEQTSFNLKRNGDNYLELAKELIQSNPDSFTDFPGALVTATPSVKAMPKDNGAVFGL
nr:DUF6712 family protein [uncultured Flavobacterium sp.]